MLLRHLSHKLYNTLIVLILIVFSILLLRAHYRGLLLKQAYGEDNMSQEARAIPHKLIDLEGSLDQHFGDGFMLISGSVHRLLLLIFRLLLLTPLVIGRFLLFFLVLVSLSQPVWKLAKSRRAIQRSFDRW